MAISAFTLFVKHVSSVMVVLTLDTKLADVDLISAIVLSCCSYIFCSSLYRAMRQHQIAFVHVRVDAEEPWLA